MARLLLSAWLVVVAVSIAGNAAEFRPDIEYAVVDGERLKLDASVPDGAGPFPVAILVHGGGWCKGDKALEHVPPTQPITDADFTWFSINYRLAPQYRWPACIDDVRTAIRWVKAHAAEYKGDPRRIALMGYSAGGHLAAFAAVTAEEDTRTQAVVVLAGPTDLVADSERRGGLSPSLQALFDRDPAIDGDAREILAAASPIVRAGTNSPPCLLIHGTVDESVLYPQSVNFQTRMKELGVPCELITIPGGSHDLKRWETIDPRYQQKMVDWLREQLRSDP